MRAHMLLEAGARFIQDPVLRSWGGGHGGVEAGKQARLEDGGRWCGGAGLSYRHQGVPNHPR